MPRAANVQDIRSAGGQETAQYGARPIVNRRRDESFTWQIDPHSGMPQIRTNRGLVVNSMLRQEEWERLDAAVVQAAVHRLNGIAHLRERGLVLPLGSLGVLTSQFSQVSEMTAADVNMSGRSRTERDRVDFDLEGRPVPIISKEYEIGQRELLASRLGNTPIDTTHAAAAARVVAEMSEQILFEGSNLKFRGDSIYGYTTHPNRNNDTAGSYGGGDFGTESNGVKTIAGMINAANGDNFFGPFVVYIATTQYNELANSFHTDGSGDSELERVMRLASIENVYPSDVIGDGELVLVQMTSDVVDLAEVTGFVNRNVEWTSPDGTVTHFRVMTVHVPRIKSDYSGNCGVVHATGA